VPLVRDAAHDISPLQEQLILELKRGVESAELIGRHPGRLRCCLPSPEDQQLQPSPCHPAPDHRARLQASPPMANWRKSARASWLGPAVNLQQVDMEDVVDLGVSGKLQPVRHLANALQHHERRGIEGTW
jgi:hypothetical protein